MSTRSPDDISLSHDAVSAVKRYPVVARKLPPFPEEWHANELNIPQAAIHVFAKNGVINKQATERVNGNTRCVWQTRDGLQAWVDRHLADDDGTTPCGRTGVRNLGSGEYTCSHDECDCRFGREVAEEVVAG